MRPACRDSLPRVGLTVSSCCLVSSTGRAPSFSTSARSLASCSVNEPEIWPRPFGICSLIVGADSTWRSSTMASCWLTRRWVMSENLAAPALFISKSISQPTFQFTDVDDAVRYTAVALEMASPVISTGPSVYAIRPPASDGLLRYVTVLFASSTSRQPGLLGSSVGHCVILGLLHWATSAARSAEHPVSLVVLGSNATWPVTW